MIEIGGEIVITEIEDGNYVQISQFDKDDILVENILMTRRIAIEIAKHILETLDFRE